MKENRFFLYSNARTSTPSSKGAIRIARAQPATMSFPNPFVTVVLILALTPLGPMILTTIASMFKQPSICDNTVSMASDQWAVSNRRSEFNWHRDQYLRGQIDQSQYILLISPFISDDFTVTIIETEMMASPWIFTGKAAFVQWLIEEPPTKQLEGNLLSNLRIYPRNKFGMDVWTYVMNRFEFNNGPHSTEIVVSALEHSTWVKTLAGEWCMQSYTINGTSILYTGKMSDYARARASMKESQ